MYKSGMDLAAYMKTHGLDDVAMGEKLSKSRVTVSRYRRGLETPSADTIKVIVEVTEGAVSANDLLGIQETAE